MAKDFENVLEDHVELLLTEVSRQDDVKSELSQQGRQMLRVLFIGISVAVAAISSFGPPEAYDTRGCVVTFPSSCIQQGHFVLFALGLVFISAFFYTLISGIDFIAPYSVVELVDTREIIQYEMTGEQYYRNKVGKLSRRIEYNRQHIRALEQFGATAGGALVLSLLSISILAIAILYAPISYWVFLVILLAIIPLFVLAHRAIPPNQRRREPGPLGTKS